jgi:hypothetical protein
MELKIWVKKSSNGMYIVNKMIKEGSIMSHAEYEVYSFNNIKELSDWLEKAI